jgi:rubrerythrin
MDMMTLLAGLERMEEGLAQLYEEYASRFVDDLQVALLFQTLSHEETDHLNLVRYQQRLCRESDEAFPEVPVDAAHIAAAYSRITALREGLGGARPEDAVRGAVACERDAVETLYRTAMVKAHPGLAGMVSVLAQDTDSHLAQLTDFAARRKWLE